MTRTEFIRLCKPPRQAGLGLILLVLMALPSARNALEASMARHMLLQFPLLLCGGALLAAGIPQRLRQALARWNAYGISGLLATALVLAVLMVPRALDLALVNPGIEAAKCAVLVLAGGALGNVLPMTAVVGQLYIDSPTRICNAYLLDDQALLGQWLVWLALAVAVGWLAQAAWAVARKG